MDIAELRSDTPGLRNRVHLNSAGASLMPTPVIDAVVDHIRLESEIGGYEAADDASDAIGQAYEDVAALLGTSSDRIAMSE
ncbi:MAG: cysteine desulfurase, partial [Gemmatimonadota bacterium]|nr:cysteine desulfurase [Gemmatimonadota bacterium]